MKNAHGYKVLITTSGVGQRLGDLTKHTNNSLVRLLKKPIISHIIDLYPDDMEFVITLGHHGNLVKEFLKLVYPQKIFQFINVDKYEGDGSSLAYTMLKAKDALQTPFIFHAGDTVVLENVPNPLKFNWVGGVKGGASARYRSFNELDEKVYSFNDKGATDYDYLHIGLVGIKDYSRFWEAMKEKYDEEPSNQFLGDVPILEIMMKEGVNIIPHEFKTWLDIGNIESLIDARKKLGDHLVNLDKAEESTYIFDDKFVVKFMHNSNVVEKRFSRAKKLYPLVPKLLGNSEHFYCYEYVRGKLYSRAANPQDFVKFLDWSKKNVWKPKQAVSQKEFKKICKEFYFTKTLKRIQDFYEKTGIVDKPLIINGQHIPKLSEILDKINFDWLSDGLQTVFHGDYILDNIIRTKEGYSLIDWREDFGGLLESGDMYYDLAKLNHNLTLNHDLIFSNQFTVKVRGELVTVDVLRSDNLVACQETLWNFIKKEDLDLHKVKMLSSVAWLNMCPLHHKPYNLFLYYYGILNLWKNSNL